jgi:hypothetical protein
MSVPIKPPTFGEIIDDLDKIREELFTLQRTMEDMEVVKTPAPNGKTRKNPR